MSTSLANYHSERRAFESLLDPNCDKQILMFRAESGFGKTRLLSYCRSRAVQSTSCINIDLKGGAVNVAEIFSLSGGKLGWEGLPIFTNRVASFEGNLELSMDKNQIAGINNRITAIINKDPTDQNQRRASLTEAFFADLNALQGQVLFVLDTFEKATIEVQEWIDGPFLARIEQTKKVRALIAGQKIPDEGNIGWGHSCTVHDLYGVKDAEHWVPIVEELNRQVPYGDPMTYMAGVCYALNGRPSEIMQAIRGLPVKGSVR